MRCLISLSLFAVCLGVASTITADLVEFRLTGNGGNGLLESNVTPPTGSPGSGGIGFSGITFDTNTSILHVDVEWGSGNGYSDLTGPVTMLHLHGPTEDLPPDSFSQTGPLMINLALSLSFDPSASSGGVNGNFLVDNPDVAGLLEGRTYINVHTEAFEFGEIRGYLVRVPEPTTLLPAGGLALLIALRRNRRRC